jgi:hypothetical protein
MGMFPGGVEVVIGFFPFQPLKDALESFVQLSIIKCTTGRWSVPLQLTHKLSQ